MEEYGNIYDDIKLLKARVSELEQRDKEFAKVMAWVLKNEPLIVDEGRKAQLDVDDDLEGYYTINDILRKYKISRQCLYNYRKHVPLKKVTTIGRFDRFKKVKVHEFMRKIVDLKQTEPQLFKIKFNKAS